MWQHLHHGVCQAAGHVHPCIASLLKSSPLGRAKCTLDAVHCCVVATLPPRPADQRPGCTLGKHLLLVLLAWPAKPLPVRYLRDAVTLLVHGLVAHLAEHNLVGRLTLTVTTHTTNHVLVGSKDREPVIDNIPVILVLGEDVHHFLQFLGALAAATVALFSVSCNIVGLPVPGRVGNSSLGGCKSFLLHLCPPFPLLHPLSLSRSF
mmetsp:Transcript_8135/g.20913  ORF Transcript_8135/g.20913 Transcript_8135/m.20913 type:complete len:206 (-) Transcript_8135:1818-2435(-)